MYPGIRAVPAGQLDGTVPDGPGGVGVDQPGQLLDGTEGELMQRGQRAAPVGGRAAGQFDLPKALRNPARSAASKPGAAR